MSELGRVLEQARVARGLTKRDAAAKIGISDTHLGDLERGKAAASDEMLTKVLNYYGIALSAMQYSRHSCIDSIKRLVDTNKDFIPVLQRLATSKVSPSQLDQFLVINSSTT